MSYTYEIETEKTINVGTLHQAILLNDPAVVAVIIGITIHSESPNCLCMEFETEPSAADRTIINGLI